MKKPIKILIITALVVCLAILAIIVLEPKAKYYMNLGVEYVRNIKGVKVPEIHSKSDKNNNGISDPIDIVNSSRREAENKTNYKDAYYVGGYPPENEGVCTDVIWRGFKGMGLDLKALVDKDIKNNAAVYPRVAGKPDPNIDFRRVRNLDVFFKRNAINVTKELIPFDVENLKEWQPGDIVIIMEPFEHIAIVSDKRAKNGVPYVIHNTSPHAVENGSLLYWAPYIYGHYRWRF
jgi:uncharacterized protein YijF (DUF1287 family)